ncbi:MAG: polysaccharide biosynthesis C-terminal domain-containing protein, partial [Gammaproteobacteria bacterium]|nr:polysaccharide biosynthesis C-terminal domain-containing protein [Gammaproteobacteria bacterium]
LFARKETDGINDLYWQSAIWITLITFPVFAVCLFLSEQVTVLLFGTRYSEAAILLAILSIGTFFNAALGLNAYTLQVFAKVRFITWMNIVAAITALTLYLWLIPLYGALGAAIATTGAVVVHNLLIHSGLLLGTGVDVFNLRYLKVYGTVLISILGLLLVNTIYTPPTFITIVLLTLVSLLLFIVNRNVLSIGSTFPEISRVPVLRRLLGVQSNI